MVKLKIKININSLPKQPIKPLKTVHSQDYQSVFLF